MAMSLVQNQQYDSSGGDVVTGYGSDQASQLEGGWPQTELRRLLAGSAGVVVFVTGYGPYLPHVGTSPSVVDVRSIARASGTSAAKPTNEMAP